MVYANKEIKTSISASNHLLTQQSTIWINRKENDERMPLYGQYKIEMAWQNLDCQSIMRTFSTDWGTMYLSLPCNYTQRHIRQTD